MKMRKTENQLLEERKVLFERIRKEEDEKKLDEASTSVFLFTAGERLIYYQVTKIVRTGNDIVFVTKQGRTILSNAPYCIYYAKG
jgi:hypothetical protein